MKGSSSAKKKVSRKASRPNACFSYAVLCIVSSALKSEEVYEEKTRPLKVALCIWATVCAAAASVYKRT